MSAPVHVYLIAGEPSGDVLGGRLMQALQSLAGDAGVRFSGVGGPLMSAAGLDSLFPMDELAVMGLSEVLPRLPNILKRIRETSPMRLPGRTSKIFSFVPMPWRFRKSRPLPRPAPLSRIEWPTNVAATPAFSKYGGSNGSRHMT